MSQLLKYHTNTTTQLTRELVITRIKEIYLNTEKKTERAVELIMEEVCIFSATEYFSCQSHFFTSTHPHAIQFPLFLQYKDSEHDLYDMLCRRHKLSFD